VTGANFLLLRLRAAFLVSLLRIVLGLTMTSIENALGQNAWIDTRVQYN